MLKKILGMIAALLLSSTSFAADVAQQPAPKLNLGVIVPLTGPLAFFGNDYVRAYELAVEAHPEMKNNLNVVFEDSAYDTKQAIAAFNKLVSLSKVNIVMSFGGPMLNALAPVAESRKIPFYATESAKADCEGRDYCSLFRNEEDEWGKATWMALRKRGKKRIGIVKNQNQFMDTFVNAIIRTKAADESVEIALDVAPDAVDLRTDVLPLKTKSYDALGVYFLPPSHHGFLNAMRQYGHPFDLFGVEEFLVKENNKGFESLIDGALVIAPAATESYRAQFEGKYGHSAGFFYTPAFYDFLALLNDTIRSNRALRGIELVKAMRFVGSREGVSGKFSVKVSEKGVHSYSFPIKVYKVSGGNATVDQEINF